MWSISVLERDGEPGLAVLAQPRSRAGGSMKLQFSFLVL